MAPTSTTAITSLQVTTPRTQFILDGAAGDRFSGGGALFTGASGDNRRSFIGYDPAGNGWDYQSFGAWNTKLATGGSVAALSIGSVSSAAALPTTGTARFTGSLAGIYFEQTGGDHLAVGGVTLGVDFAARRATMDVGVVVDPFLQIPFWGSGFYGELTYAADQNLLTGQVATYAQGDVTHAFNGRMTGAVEARFFGPAAQELGGVISLAAPAGSTSREALVAGFGAKR